MLPWFSPVSQRFFNRLMERRLHHALLLAGPAGIGKGILARWLGKVLLCKQPVSDGACGQCQSCMLFEAETHPDYLQLMSEKQIGVDLIRDGIRKLSGTAQLGGNKVMVIFAADSLTESAANALLKTLEEPTGNTYILLITDKIQRLLPTILSRCEKQVFSVPESHLSLEWLKSQGVTNASVALLKAYGGAPLRLKGALEQQEGLSYQLFFERFTQLLCGQTDALELAREWQENAEQVVNWCQLYAHEQYIQHQQSEDQQRFSHCLEAKRVLQHPGVNKSVVLTGLLSLFA
ncbi:DNA polymerase III subunit delta' [Alteromonas aestuariivivens]|uniref:DNA-directed DNA polymerase n=1 Tax=Alteromonas aestuariivivens TaxID=1938339 RepID=A0A3D8MAZ1_9ALTE|nr:DNA polymerase III subunit delta' [Alteromonas aestuariivivens]RDV27418.1 DNA polymerase III subunit delta' [Alteromonas aestuariivivens]